MKTFKGGKMYKKLMFFCMMLVILSFQVVCGQVLERGFSLNGNGARAAGMGYAFTGLADDATAISWNAAGLTQLQSPEASIITRFGFGAYSIDIPDVDVDIETSSKFQLNFASIVFPFSVSEKNVVGGIAFRRFFDFSNKNFC